MSLAEIICEKHGLEDPCQGCNNEAAITRSARISRARESLDRIHASLLQRRVEERRIASERLTAAQTRYQNVDASKPRPGQNKHDAKLAALQHDSWTEKAAEAFSTLRQAESVLRELDENHRAENSLRIAARKLCAEHPELADALRDEELRAKEQSRLDALLQEAIEELNRSHNTIHALAKYGRYCGQLQGRVSLLDRVFARLACHGKVLLIPWLESFRPHVCYDVTINYVRPKDVPEFYVTDDSVQQHAQIVRNYDAGRSWSKDSPTHAATA